MQTAHTPSPWRKRIASTVLLLIGLFYMIWPTPVLNHMQEVLSVTLCLVGISILSFFWHINKKEPVYRVLGKVMLFSIGIVYATWPTRVQEHHQETWSILNCIFGISLVIYFWYTGTRVRFVHRLLGALFVFAGIGLYISDLPPGIPFLFLSFWCIGDGIATFIFRIIQQEMPPPATLFELHPAISIAIGIMMAIVPSDMWRLFIIFFGVIAIFWGLKLFIAPPRVSDDQRRDEENSENSDVE